MVNRKQGHGQTELTKPWQEHLSSSWVFIKVKNRTDSKCRAEFRKNQGLDKLKVLKDKWLSWALLHQRISIFLLNKTISKFLSRIPVPSYKSFNSEKTAHL